MGMLDMMLPSDLMKKATDAVQLAEARRKLAAKKVIADIARAAAAGQNVDAAVEAGLAAVLAATSQSGAVRDVGKVVAASKVMGAGLIGEVLGRVADKLDGKG